MSKGYARRWTTQHPSPPEKMNQLQEFLSRNGIRRGPFEDPLQLYQHRAREEVLLDRGWAAAAPQFLLVVIRCGYYYPLSRVQTTSYHHEDDGGIENREARSWSHSAPFSWPFPVVRCNVTKCLKDDGDHMHSDVHHIQSFNHKFMISRFDFSLQICFLFRSCHEESLPNDRDGNNKPI